jgi:BirA family transcriptional regulator, biotin operon repressor / biotin---[acetyl-CoA-carboxylase] ligase
LSTPNTYGRDPLGGFRHEALGDVGSTNTECLLRARAGDPGGLWITAERQTGGRGRRGREWVSEAGNLYASLLLIDPAPLPVLASLPLAVAVAVHDAVRRVLPLDAAQLDIKWPNDILIGRRKTSGILLEGEKLPDGRQALIIGIGVNVAFKPEGTAFPATCLAEHGAHVSPQELFAYLFTSMADMLSLWNGGSGISAVVERWRSHACGIGERITVNLSNRSVSGVFRGIGADGVLMLETGAGEIMPVAAGDVFFE